MTRAKTIFSMLIPSFILTCLLILNIYAQSHSTQDQITIRQAPKEVVLYTVYRGPYNKVGSAIGSLYTLAGKNRIAPAGAPYYVYLNNPARVAPEHYLTEIRIPVGPEALKLTGTLGPMTGVKSLPTTDLAVAVKPEGLADPATIYSSLYGWILQEGYIVVDSAREVFLTNAMSGDYSRMKSEIMIPVQKIPPAKQ